MAETPFERILRHIGRDAVRANDSASVTVIARMIAYVQQGQYAALRPLIEKLKPVYRGRLGVLPKSRDEDVAMNPDRDSGRHRRL